MKNAARAARLRAPFALVSFAAVALSVGAGCSSAAHEDASSQESAICWFDGEVYRCIRRPPPPAPPPIIQSPNVAMNTPQSVEEAITGTLTFATPRGASMATVVLSNVYGVIKTTRENVASTSHSITYPYLKPSVTYSYSITLDTQGPHVVYTGTFTAPAAPPDDGKVHTGTAMPRYNVVSLLYAPPGNGSNASYTNGVTTGSSQSIQDSFKVGPTVSLTSTVVDVGLSVQAAMTSGNGADWSETFSEGWQLTSNKDQLDHGQDTFILWLNPALEFKGTSSNITVTTMTRNGAPPEICAVTVAELLDPSTVSSGKLATCHDLAALLADDEDRTQILALDPFVKSQAVDAARFQHLGQFPITGPDKAGDATIATTVSLGQSHDDNVSVGTGYSAQVSIAIGGGFAFFVDFSLKAGVQLNWDYTKSITQSTGSSNTVAVSLTTSTPQYGDLVDVYMDRLFHSYAFVSKNDSHSHLVYNPPGSGGPQATAPVTVERTGAGTVIGAVGTSVSPATMSLDCGVSCTSWYPTNATVTLQATPDAGWTFAGWGGACAGTSPTCAVHPSQATTVQATFVHATSAPQRTLTVKLAEDATCTGNANAQIDTTPSWLVCGMAQGGARTCTATFGAGSIVDLWPTMLTSDTKFMGFSGDCTGTTCSLYMNGDRNVTATFCGLFH